MGGCDLGAHQSQTVAPAPSTLVVAASASTDQDDLTFLELVGKSCASAAGQEDPVEAALKNMREASRGLADVPGADIAWEAPTAQAEVAAALEKLAKISSSGPYLAEEALQAMLAVGRLKPKLPKSHGQDIDSGVPHFLHGVAAVPGLRHERCNTSLRGRFIRDSMPEDACDTKPPLGAITRGCIVLRLGSADFYHVDTISRRYGKKWFRSEADTTDDGSMRLWCRKLILADGRDQLFLNLRKSSLPSGSGKTF